MVRLKYCFVAFSLLLLVTLSACTPWATWPRIEGSPSLSTPTYHPIPRLCVLSVGAIREELGDESPLVINQLPGLNEKEAEEFMVNFPGATTLTEAGHVPLDVGSGSCGRSRVEVLVPTEQGNVISGSLNSGNRSRTGRLRALVASASSDQLQHLDPCPRGLNGTKIQFVPTGLTGPSVWRHQKKSGQLWSDQLGGDPSCRRPPPNVQSNHLSPLLDHR